MNAYGTIVARNYLPHARLLARSFQRHHPDDIFVCLVTDARAGQDWEDDELNAQAGLRVVTPAELPVDAELFSAMAFIYDVMELATALKPFLLRLLLAEVGPGAAATYLDPDMYVYGPVPALRSSSDAVALLTPHRLSPAPLDSLIPQEALFLRHGAFNLGYISVNAQAGPLLDWWGERLTVDAVIAPREALFTDQKWMDLAHVYFAVEQLREAGVNVAWWNIDERQFRREHDHVTVNGDLLRLAHFSGYRPGKTPFVPRTRPGQTWQESWGIFSELAQEYLRELEQETATGSGREQDVRYAFATYADGRTVTGYERRRFRRQLRASLVSGQPLPAAPWHESSSLREEARRRAFAAVDSTVGQALPWDLIAARLKRRKVRV
ncbi:MAG: hypothetical protein QOI54_2778 [Actinomycetota bacterium]|nr:hypothetical protein [Actinomycetota bacterium]